MVVSAGEGSYPPAAPTGLTDNEDMAIRIDNSQSPMIRSSISSLDLSTRLTLHLMKM